MGDWWRRAIRRQTDEEIADEYVSDEVAKIERLNDNCKRGSYCRQLGVPQERYDELYQKGQILMEDLQRLVGVGGPLMADIAALYVKQNWTNLNAIYRLISVHLRNIPNIVNAVVAFSKSLYSVLLSLKAIAAPFLRSLINNVMSWITSWLRNTPRTFGQQEISAICYGVSDVRLKIKSTADTMSEKAKQFETRNKRDTALIYVRGSIKIRELDARVEVERCQCFSENSTS